MAPKTDASGKAWGVPARRFTGKKRGLVRTRALYSMMDEGTAHPERSRQILARMQQLYGPLDDDKARAVAMLLSLSKGYLGIGQNVAFRDMLAREQFYCSTDSYTWTELKTLCPAMRLRSGRGRQSEDLKRVFEQYREVRETTLRQIWAVSGGHDAPAWRYLCLKNEGCITLDLAHDYGRMHRQQLVQQCEGRALSGSWSTATSNALRARLQESDKAFDSHFPDDEDIRQLSRERLRRIARAMGVSQGRTIHDVIENLRSFSKYRAAMRGSSALERFCLNISGEKADTYDSPLL